MATRGESPENSFVLGSEDIDNLQCQPCHRNGNSTKTVGMCVTCQEYLCQQCFDVHQSPKPCIDHELLKMDQMLKSQISLACTDTCTEFCEDHHDEVIRFHCVDHDILGCIECMNDNHRKCEQVVSIQKIAKDLHNNAFFQEVEAELIDIEQKSKKIDILSSKKKTALGIESSRTIEKVQTFREEIIRKLDTIVSELKENTLSITDEEIDKITKLTDQCKQSQIDAEHMLKKVQKLKSGKQNCGLYLYFVEIKSHLKPLHDQLLDVEHKLSITDANIKFNQNREIIEDLEKSDTIGNVSLENPHLKDTTKISFNEITTPLDGVTESTGSFIHVKDIYVKVLKEEKRTCSITGLILLPNKMLVVADSNNKSLKIVDINKGRVTSHFPLTSKPKDIVLVESNQIAVTLPGKKQIAFINLTAPTVADRYLTVRGKCVSIAYSTDKLAVIYNGIDELDILNLQGEILCTINILNLYFVHISYCFPTVAFSRDSESLYVTRPNYSNGVQQYSLEGKVLSTYKDGKLKDPKKVITDNKGNVYVSDARTNTVYELSSNLRAIRILSIQDLFQPFSICYNEPEGEFYFGMEKNNIVKINKVLNN